MSGSQGEKVGGAEPMNVDEDEDLDILFGEEVAGPIDPRARNQVRGWPEERLIPQERTLYDPRADHRFWMAVGAQAIAANREARRSPPEWMPNVPSYKDYDGKVYKWVNGERYMKTNVRRPAYEAVPMDPGNEWIVTPLVNNNPAPQDVLIHLYAYTPLYTIVTGCSLVCKDWRRAFKMVPDDLWFQKLREEFDIGPPTVYPFTPLMYLKRKMRAVQILRGVLEQDSETAADPHYLVWKGFPLPAQSRQVGKIAGALITKWREEDGLVPRLSKGDKGFWSPVYRIAYQLGPFTENEFADGEDSTKTWQIYVRKLLYLAGYLVSSDIEPKDGRSLDRAKKRGQKIIKSMSDKDRAPTLKTEDRVVTINALTHLLRDGYQIPIRLSDRMYLAIEEGYEHAAVKKYTDQRAERRREERRVKRKYMDIKYRQDVEQKSPPEATEPDIVSIISKFAVGFYVDLFALTEKGPWSAKFQPNRFPAVTLVHPMYINSNSKDGNGGEEEEGFVYPLKTKGQSRSLKILVFQSGYVTIVGAKNLEMVHQVYEDTKSILIPFKINDAMTPKEIQDQFAAAEHVRYRIHNIAQNL